MAIHFIYGTSGAGKTYYAVHHLLKTFFRFSKESNQYSLKEKCSDITIVSNIDKFLLPHESLDDWILKVGSAEKFFCYEMQERAFEKYGPIVYMIDEAHEYFPGNFKNESVLNWFSYHRHWGQTIYLMSQAHSRLPRKITDMVELSIYALPPSSTLMGGRDLKYNVISGRERVDTKNLIKNKKIFSLYRSQHADAAEKSRNPMMKFIVAGFVLSAFILFQGYNFVQSKVSPDVDKKVVVSEVVEKRSIVDSVNVSVPDIEQTTDELINVRLGYINSNTKGLKIVLGSRIYSFREFPYKLHKTDFNELFCQMPASHYSRYFPTPPATAGTERSRDLGRAAPPAPRMTRITGRKSPS